MTDGTRYQYPESPFTLEKSRATNKIVLLEWRRYVVSGKFQRGNLKRSGAEKNQSPRKLKKGIRRYATRLTKPCISPRLIYGQA